MAFKLLLDPRTLQDGLPGELPDIWPTASFNFLRLNARLVHVPTLTH